MSLDDLLPEGFVKASALAPDVPVEELGLDVEAREYKGYAICADQSLRHPRHAARMAKGAFYVQAKSGLIGWVPWVGSTVVWPWEVGAWTQDLAREQVHADSVPAKEKKQ